MNQDRIAILCKLADRCREVKATYKYSPVEKIDELASILEDLMEALLRDESAFMVAAIQGRK